MGRGRSPGERLKVWKSYWRIQFEKPTKIHNLRLSATGWLSHCCPRASRMGREGLCVKRPLCLCQSPVHFFLSFVPQEKKKKFDCRPQLTFKASNLNYMDLVKVQFKTVPLLIVVQWRSKSVNCTSVCDKCRNGTLPFSLEGSAKTEKEREKNHQIYIGNNIELKLEICRQYSHFHGNSFNY